MRRTWAPEIGWRTSKRRGAAAAWTPASLPNLKLWAESDQGTTVATGVSQWNDLSGNGNHLVQAVGAKQPALTAAAINGLPALTFDGVDDFMQKAFTLSQPETVFIVAKMNSWTLDDQLIDGAGASDSMLIQQQGGASPSLRIYAGAFVGPTTALAVGTFGLISVKYNGASSSIQVNSGPTISGNAGAANGGGFTLAAGMAGVFCANISAAFVVLTADSVSAPDVALLKAYVTAKYGFAA